MAEIKIVNENYVRSSIIEARNAAGLSQVELAEKIGVAQNAISRWEKGIRSPSAFTWLRILQACNCTLSIRSK